MNMEEIWDPAHQCRVLWRAHRLDPLRSIENINIMKNIIYISLSVLICALLLRCLMIDYPIDKCLDLGGRWNYQEWRCDVSN